MPKRDENGKFISEDKAKNQKKKIKEKEEKRKETKKKEEKPKKITKPAIYSCNFYNMQLAVQSHNKIKDKDGKVVKFERGKHINFQNGKYETNDKEEIKFLDAWDKGILRDPLINISKVQNQKYE